MRLQPTDRLIVQLPCNASPDSSTIGGEDSTRVSIRQITLALNDSDWHSRAEHRNLLVARYLTCCEELLRRGLCAENIQNNILIPLK